MRLYVCRCDPDWYGSGNAVNKGLRLAVNYSGDKCVRAEGQSRQDVSDGPLNQRIHSVEMVLFPFQTV